MSPSQVGDPTIIYDFPPFKLLRHLHFFPSSSFEKQLDPHWTPTTMKKLAPPLSADPRTPPTSIPITRFPGEQSSAHEEFAHAVGSGTRSHCVSAPKFTQLAMLDPEQQRFSFVSSNSTLLRMCTHTLSRWLMSRRCLSNAFSFPYICCVAYLKRRCSWVGGHLNVSCLGGVLLRCCGAFGGPNLSCLFLLGFVAVDPNRGWLFNKKVERKKSSV